MRHEPSDSLPPLQPITDQRCPSCRAVKPLDDFPIGAPRAAMCSVGAAVPRSPTAAGSGPCGRSRAGPRPVTAPCSPTTPAKGVVAMRPERPECQCLACAQLQHHRTNDTLLLVAIGVVVVVSGLVWLTGQVAGLLASGAWPDVAVAELPGILARLRDHPGDPAAAWPAGVRPLLPGPVGMYATLTGILTTPLALGVLAWWLHQPPSPPRPPATPAPRGRRTLPPAAHPRVPMLPPPEHDWEAL
jgi:hypothetical protein